MVTEQKVSDSVVEEKTSTPIETEQEEVTEEKPEPTPEEIQAELAELRQLRESHAGEIKKAQADAEERIRRIQSVKDTEVAEATRRATELTRRQSTFDSLVGLAQAADEGDVGAAEQLQKALRDPTLSEVWAWGHRASQPQAVAEKVHEGQVSILNRFQFALEAHESFKELGRDKIMEIRQASPDQETYILNLSVALADHKAEALAEKLLAEKLADHEESVKARVLEGERRKSGGVAELKGGGSGKTAPLNTVKGIIAARNTGQLTDAEASVRIRDLAQ